MKEDIKTIIDDLESTIIDLEFKLTELKITRGELKKLYLYGRTTKKRVNKRNKQSGKELF